MAKFKAIDEELHSRVVAAVASAWDEGSPVTGWRPEDWDRMANVAIRRWRSFTRRGVSDNDRNKQVRDVSRGFVQAFEDDPKLVGPLIVDYEDVAEKVLATIEDYQSRDRG